MESNQSSSDITSTGSDYCFVPNPSLDFEPSEIDVAEAQFKGVSNMSTLFSPKLDNDQEVHSFSCKPDPDSIKMFVGQIPQTFTECDLLQMFEKYGKVYDLRVLREKSSGKSKGCCFVTFFTRRAALNAQDALHNIKVLPGMHHPIQMKPADSENRNDRKLFVGMLPRKYSESDVRTLFSPYGTIEECTVLRDINRQSKGCAFVTYLSRQSAQNAVRSMHHCHIFEGCSSPIVVKFADTQKDKEIRRMHLVQHDLHDQNNVSSILQQLGLSTDTLTSLVTSNNLLYQLHGNNNHQLPLLNHVNLSPTVPIVNWPLVQPRPLNLQKTPSSYFMNQLGAQNIPSVSLNDIVLNNLLSQLNSSVNLGLLSQAYPGTAAPLHYQHSALEEMVRKCSVDRMANSKQIEGPEGANLFIYHLPHDFNDQRLTELFSPFGKVISAKVFIDKFTKLSKCFGFVSYDNMDSAKAAIHNLNGYHILGKKLKVEVKKKRKH